MLLVSVSCFSLVMTSFMGVMAKQSSMPLETYKLPASCVQETKDFISLDTQRNHLSSSELLHAVFPDASQSALFDW